MWRVDSPTTCHAKQLSIRSSPNLQLREQLPAIRTAQADPLAPVWFGSPRTLFDGDPLTPMEASIRTVRAGVGSPPRDLGYIAEANRNDDKGTGIDMRNDAWPSQRIDQPYPPTNEATLPRKHALQSLPRKAEFRKDIQVSVRLAYRGAGCLRSGGERRG